MRLAALLVLVGFLGTVRPALGVLHGGGARSRGAAALPLPSARLWPRAGPRLDRGAPYPAPPDTVWVPSAGSTNSTWSPALRGVLPESLRGSFARGVVAASDPRRKRKSSRLRRDRVFGSCPRVLPLLLVMLFYSGDLRPDPQRGIVRGRGKFRQGEKIFGVRKSVEISVRAAPLAEQKVFVHGRDDFGLDRLVFPHLGRKWGIFRTYAWRAEMARRVGLVWVGWGGAATRERGSSLSRGPDPEPGEGGPCG